MKRIIYIAILIFVAISCGNKKDGNKKKDNKDRNIQAEYKFTLPEVPYMITDELARKEYIAEHFWDSYNFKDTSFLVSKQGKYVFAGYINLLLQFPEEKAVQYIDDFFQTAESDSCVCMEMFSLSEKYLYDPNSPLRNESLYIAVLEKILSWEKLAPVYKIRPEYQYELALKNRPGNPAADFVYTLKGGVRHRLYSLKSDYILIYFNNPGCGDCKRVGKLLSESQVINKLIARRKLSLLSLYPDKDITEWEKALKLYPSSWIKAYDKDVVIKTKEIYDLRAIPTLYLLDKEKHVLLKDVSFESLEKYLSR